MNISRIIEDPNFSSENNISNNLIPKNEESDGEDLKFDDIMNEIEKDDDMILIDDDNEKKVEKKILHFQPLIKEKKSLFLKQPEKILKI